ncbi:hypothetical protein V8D89_006135 [Ganoderma adspersum]
MRFSVSLATVLAAAGLVSTSPLEARYTGHHTIEVPASKANVGSPFSFSFSDTTRNPGDTSYLQLSFYNLTYRGVLGTVQFDKTDYTEATGSVTVPSQIVDGGYLLVVDQLDKGNQLYSGDVQVYFSR